ncbi:MAG TPA: tRNA (adenosine(37)-N6)-threonylcarbamoyltransferase complex ATPase subunit type 1 TsaE [Gammaproteobacteria bacterium]|nr:tRNA (adenosine(37)-N6)-threonylcarbamoyltransferase complex ATPase subunit type 1 TsaE [Gammaproteobacteria bacterium]
MAIYLRCSRHVYSGCTFALPSEAATVALGEQLAKAVVAAGARMVFLRGDLGAGKTTLSRGFLQQLGHEGHVKSPTYTLIESYPQTTPPAHHLDLYRLADPEELEYLGLRELLTSRDICLIEWPERGSGCLPPADLTIELRYQDERRTARVSVGENSVLLRHISTITI